LGEPIPSKAYREREDSEIIDNFDVEINNMIPIYERLINVYIKDISLSVINRGDFVFPYFEKMLDILRPWSKFRDLNAVSREDNLSEDQINYTMWLLSETERKIAIFYSRRNQLDIAENHCQRALSYARRYSEDGENKTLELMALTHYCNLRLFEGDFVGAVNMAKDLYNCGAGLKSTSFEGMSFPYVQYVLIQQRRLREHSRIPRVLLDRDQPS
jgi:hypothetical protein